MRVPLAALLCVVAFGAGTGAQARPDLSGTWVLEPFRGVGIGGFGHEVVLSQRGDVLTVETPLVQVHGGSPGGMTAEVAGRHAVTFRLNGEDTVQQFPPPAAVRGRMSMTTVDRIARAAWMGDQLVIVEHNLSGGFEMDGRPRSSRQTVRRALSLAPDGTLIVEALIVADPVTLGRRMDPPAPTRWVYRKAR